MKRFLQLIPALCVSVFAFFSCGNRSNGKYTNLPADDFERLIEDDNVQCVDVRTVAEYSEGHIPGSLNINILDERFVSDADELLDKNHPVAVYCKSGRRSRNAAEKLTKEGFTVYNLDKGIEGWKKEGKYIEK